MFPPAFMRTHGGGDRYIEITRESIERFESGLEAFIRTEGYEDLAERQENYKRQYEAYTTPDGDRLMFVFFMCKPLPGWESAIQHVTEGGDCYFEVIYNLDRNRYQILDVHH